MLLRFDQQLVTKKQRAHRRPLQRGEPLLLVDLARQARVE